MKKSVNSNNQYESILLPYSVIEKAVNGYYDEMNMVLSYFESYIASLANRKFYDSYGNVYYREDEELRLRLRLKLTKAILLFRL